jgi:hypothetical protein
MKYRAFYRRHETSINIGGPIALLAIFVFAGFGERPAVVKQCQSTYSRWWDANYSETRTALDADGERYDYTHYSSSEASNIYTVRTVDGFLRSTTYDFEPSEDPDGYFYPPYPSKPHSSRWMVYGKRFERFSQEYSRKLKVYTTDGDSFEMDIDKSSKCTALVDDVIMVKTWYRISYEWMGTRIEASS